MATKKNTSLPEEIFVYREQDGKESYLTLWEDLEEAVESSEEGTLIGTYTLNHTAKYAIDRTVTEL